MKSHSWLQYFEYYENNCLVYICEHQKKRDSVHGRVYEILKMIILDTQA